MKHILVGTNRRGSLSFSLAQYVQSLYSEQNEKVEIINLADLPLHELNQDSYQKNQSLEISKAVDTVSASDGLIVVCPEYNGSMPGALKYFIDFWHYPKTFEFRPFCLIGLGGRWGGLRPVEHLQGVFGYRNGFIYPERVFLNNINKVLIDGKIVDANVDKLLRSQASGFSKFVLALKSQKLDANSKIN